MIKILTQKVKRKDKFQHFRCRCILGIGGGVHRAKRKKIKNVLAIQNPPLLKGLANKKG